VTRDAGKCRGISSRRQRDENDVGVLDRLRGFAARDVELALDEALGNHAIANIAGAAARRPQGDGVVVPREQGRRTHARWHRRRR
jgi:hypothetical protein